jgi:hypothetical protein
MWRIITSGDDWLARAANYLVRLGDAVSQLANVIIGGTNPNESISGRAWRLRTRKGWKQARAVIDFIFSPFEKNHCHMSYVADLHRARKLIAESAARGFDIL